MFMVSNPTDILSILRQCGIATRLLLPDAGGPPVTRPASDHLGPVRARPDPPSFAASSATSAGRHGLRSSPRDLVELVEGCDLATGRGNKRRPGAIFGAKPCDSYDFEIF